MGIDEERYGDEAGKNSFEKKKGEYDFSNFYPRPPAPSKEQILQENFIKMMKQKEQNGGLPEPKEATSLAASSGMNIKLSTYELQGTFYIGQHPADITNTVLDLAYNSKLVIAAKYCTDKLLVKTEEETNKKVREFLQQAGKIIYADKGALHVTKPTIVIDAANFKETDLEDAIFRLIEFGNGKVSSSLLTIIFQPTQAKRTAIYQVIDEKTASVVGAGAALMPQSGNFAFVEIKKLKI
ncbi:hypothetical protein HY837_01165 [archaeon]|nr:hypothetical protein [archaeon]